MLRHEELSAAVEAGVITAEQRAALEVRSAGASAPRPPLAERDEPFRILRGFNDVFLTLGVLLVAGAFLTQVRSAGWTGSVGVLLAGAAALWIISEVVVGRTRAVMPGIAAVLAIGLFCSLAAAFWVVRSDAFDSLSPDVTRQFRSYPARLWFSAVGAGSLATLLYYLRFKLPFALLPLALGIIATVFFALVDRWGTDITAASLDAASLLMGLLTFAAAMAFDVSDPQRLTRRADCGFWLHLAAAPFIVHPVVATVAHDTSTIAALTTIATVSLLGVVALVVDRRALLVSSLAYFGLAVGYLVNSASGDRFSSFTTTLGLLGLFVILMGLGWHRLRALLVSPFKGSRLLSYLPPVLP